MSAPRTFGIDPGATGAIALLGAHGQLHAVYDMPYLAGRVIAPRLAGIITAAGANAHAWVEQAQSMPGQGVASTFKYGTGYGTILGVLGALEVPTYNVRPAAWKKALSLGTDKDASRRLASELWPTHAGMFARKKDDGRAEAALIAHYGRRQNLGEVA